MGGQKAVQMPKPIHGQFAQPLSIRQLTRGRGWNSDLVGFLAPFARQDFIYIEDDFTRDTLDGTMWDLGTDAGSTAFAAGTLVGGTIRGATEAASGDYILVKSAYAGATADKYPGCEIREKRDVVTATKWEFGFSDPLTDDTLPALNDIDTPSITNGATDVAAFGQDTAQTLTTPAFYADGTTGAASKVDLATDHTPVAATYERMLVQILGPNLSGAVWNNDFVNGRYTLGQGPDTAIAIRPHFIVGTLAAAAITVDVDYIRYWHER